ncbi:MAG: hypothetical protein EOO89_07970 [Pedobacter sp.]|nr:MAG: hypothetical protein EOO89_07970 [Pedobacter sp.]
MLPIDILKLQREHKYLSNTNEFADGTPSNRIIFKVLPNIGATHGEILLYTWRNSICLLPNVPVLYGKRDALDDNGELMYPDIFIVCKGVTQKQVEKYLNSEITPKKILCTPEAYTSKVKPAISNSKFTLYADFFMLIDECEKLIKDVDYRPKIILPIDDFFSFESKAMISATAVEPSDIRFAQHNFRILKIEPQYDYATNLNLITTNNVLGSLKHVLSGDSAQPYFIFVNSTDLIYSMIKALNIQNESRVFCASKSVRKLAKQGFDDASDRLKDFGLFNFLTSRFFSAVDIKVKYKPNIIMITNVDRAPFTMLDPSSDSIQIVGRLRNGLDKVVHISNVNSKIQTFEEDELLTTINDGYNEYLQLAKRKEIVQTKAGMETLKQALDGTDISLLVDEDDKLNTYMVDNVVLENRVKKLYKHSDTLKLAYQKLKNFNLKHHSLNFDISDSHLIGLEQKENNRILCEHVTTIFHIHDNPVDGSGNLQFYLSQDIKVLRSEHPEIAAFYDSVGYEAMKSLGFYKSKIARYASKVKSKVELDSDVLRSDIHKLYTLPSTIQEDTLKSDGQRIFTMHQVTKKFAAEDILRYYVARRSNDRHKVKVWKLRGLK